MANYQLIAGAIRGLAMDMVQKANSGHPGAPLGMAEMGAVLWRGHLRVNPQNPRWFNRDRFVLSNGHASAFQYALLHLSGFDLSLEDLQKFRQLHSKTPGHPEFGDVPGVETTTGPLGQGIANAVGLALAEAHLAAKYNRPNFPLIDHYTYCIVGDGCLMEGVSAEACSLAGTLGLGKLICLYDSNGISIDGEVAPYFSEDVAKRYEAYGWHVQRVEWLSADGSYSEDVEALSAAIDAARAVTDKPSIIAVRTIIGWPTPGKQNTGGIHGAKLGAEALSGLKEALGADPDAMFAVDDEAVAAVLDGRIHNPNSVAGLLAAHAARAGRWASLRPAASPWFR